MIGDNYKVMPIDNELRQKVFQLTKTLLSMPEPVKNINQFDAESFEIRWLFDHEQSRRIFNEMFTHDNIQLNSTIQDRFIVHVHEICDIAMIEIYGSKEPWKNPNFQDGKYDYSKQLNHKTVSSGSATVSPLK
jgi:hypothetical protein